tara:strand:+ start:1784 stop:1930 length:147 start_codon:yes stop_codon:yes gene_type:complete
LTIKNQQKFDRELKKADKRARLSKALRDNLHKRKEQKRAQGGTLKPKK